MSEWYYSKMGLQQGPVPKDELLTQIRRGEIDGTNLVWREGMTDWMPLSSIPELTGSSLPVIPSSNVPQPAASIPSVGGHVPLPQPPEYHGNYLAPKIPNYMWQSVTATVVGIFFCCLLGMPFGIVAIVFAAKVEGLRVSGDIHGASIASNTAKTWMIISFACSSLGLVLQIVSLVSRNF